MEGIFEKVKEFYEELPFNYEETSDEQVQTICRVNQLQAYPPLDNLLSENPNYTLLDLGCGTGWFSNSAAYWYGIDTTGVDSCSKAVMQARAASETLRQQDKVRIINADLFEIQNVLSPSFDVVNSMGVLHHTKDCYRGFRVAASMLKENGYILIGLYHKYGRQALLEMFQSVRERIALAVSDSQRAAIEKEGFTLWKELHNKSSSQCFLRSWYRDQCLHPHETQWTLREILEWCRDSNIEPLRTSLNRFEEEPDWKKLVSEEVEQRELGYQRTYNEKKYFPGFFVIWGSKKGSVISK